MAALKRSNSGCLAFRRSLKNAVNDSVNSKSASVAKEAYQCLEEHPHLREFTFAIDVAYSESDSILILSGSLPSYYLKQLLQSSLRSLDGVKKIQNEVEVSAIDAPFRDSED